VNDGRRKMEVRSPKTEARRDERKENKVEVEVEVKVE